MKKFLALLIICLPGIMVYGQNSRIKVEYKESAPAWSRPGNTKTNTMLLIAGTEGSKYFNEMSQYVDSMTSTPEGKKRLQQIQMKAWVTQAPDGSITVNKNNGDAPYKKVHTYVVKNTAGSTATVYGQWALESLVYTEPLDEMAWTIVEDSTRTVLNYECLLGETYYHGRRWKAWFTPEIPLQDGPWKFHGLPGLILLVETPEALFRFEAVGLETTDEQIPPMYQTESYSKTERKKALEQEEWGNNNQGAMLKAKYGTSVNVRTIKNSGANNEKEAPVKFVKEKHAIETDY